MSEQELGSAEVGQGSNGNLGGQAQWAIQQSKPQVDSFRIVGEPAELFAALAKARGAFRAITKNRTVKVVTRERGTYEFDYATLDEVQDATAPALSENGLAILQPFCDLPNGGKEVRTMLCHASGAYLESRTRLPAYEKIQEMGSALTYLRRYQWAAILGVSADEDDDGNAADGNKAETSPRQRQNPGPPPTKAAPVPTKKPDPKPEPKAAVVEQKPPQEAPAAATASETTPAKPAADSAIMSDATGKRLGLAFRKLEYVGDSAREFLAEQLGRPFNKGDQLSEAEGLSMIAKLNAEGAAMKQDWVEV